jgi:predicted transcriptional regulator
MNVNDLAERLSLTVWSGKNGLHREITGGYAGDLLSDVMGHAGEGVVWITIQNHKNIVAIASLKDLAAIILVKGVEPASDVLEQSELEGIPVLGTPLDTFRISTEVYQLLHE